MPIQITVRDIMTSRVISVDSKKSSWDAANTMIENDIGSVLVTEGSEYVGIVTEKDIMKKVTIKTLDPPTVKLSEIMSSPLVTIQADESLGAAALVMLERKVRRIPVVDADRIAGIITERDLNRATLNMIMSLASLS